MALTPTQISGILFKKLAAGKATTAMNREFFEEEYGARQFVDLTQIWVESNLIPETAAEVSDVVEIFDAQLMHIEGTIASFRHDNLKNIIPFNYGDAISYNYQIRENDNIKGITFGTKDWYLDTEAGILTFFAGLPDNVTVESGPYLRCYKYIGKTAADTGLGGGTFTPSIGNEWQDSVINFSDDLVTGNLGDRFIYNGVASTSADVYNFEDELFENGLIELHDIYEYFGTTSGTGFIVFKPTVGTFTSIDDLNNRIYYFNGTEWLLYESEKTYPVGVDLEPQDTFINGSAGTFNHVASNTTIPYTATADTNVDVFVNGVKLLSSQFTFAELFLLDTVVVSLQTDNTITSPVTPTAVVGDFILLNDNIWRVIVDVDGDDITYSGDVISVTKAETFEITNTRSVPMAGDYIILTDEMVYELQGSEPEPDSLVITYVRPTTS
jgi:hypothetical protein